MPRREFKLMPKSHLILIKDNKILLLRRSSEGHENSQYSFVSADMYGSESFIKVMIREAREKLGVYIKPEDMEVVHVMHVKGKKENINFFVKANKWGNEPKITEAEKYDNLNWFELDNLPKNTIPYIKHAIEFVKNGHTFYSEGGFDLPYAYGFSGYPVHETMLTDRMRMNAYFKAIQKHVKKGDVVLDFGTGTGILSFFASLKKPSKIYAIDHSDFIENARLVAEKNAIKNIEFVKINSKDFKTKQKVDIILQEQIGIYFFNEKMIENVVDLRDRLLKENGRILPNKFELFIVPVRIKDEFNIPFLWEVKIRDIDFGCLEKKIKDIRRMYRRISNNELDYFLCEPEKFYSFDLEKIGDGIPLKKIHFKKKIKKSGRLDGFCMYFKAIFDKEISFTNSPLSKETHWKSLLLRCKSKKFKKGDSIEFEMVFKALLDAEKWEWSYR